jgi:hypothetical protein
MEKQIADVRSSWVKNWEGQLDNVVYLCGTHADLLAADRSRASGQNEIRASLEKQIGSELEVHSLPDACSDALAYDKERISKLQMVNPSRVREGTYILRTPPSLHVNATQRFFPSSTALLSPA